MPTAHSSDTVLTALSELAASSGSDGLESGTLECLEGAKFITLTRVDFGISVGCGTRYKLITHNCERTETSVKYVRP